jgi:hypothetical protein
VAIHRIKGRVVRGTDSMGQRKVNTIDSKIKSGVKGADLFGYLLKWLLCMRNHYTDAKTKASMCVSIWSKGCDTSRLF